VAAWGLRCPSRRSGGSDAGEGGTHTGRSRAAKMFPQRVALEASAGEAGSSRPPAAGERSVAARDERSESLVAGTEPAAQADRAGIGNSRSPGAPQWTAQARRTRRRVPEPSPLSPRAARAGANDRHDPSDRSAGMSACGRGNVRDDLGGARDAGGLAVADQLMASAGRAGGHRPGDGHHRAAELAGVPRGVQCAAAQPRLRDHGARGQGGDEAVAGQIYLTGLPTGDAACRCPRRSFVR